MKLTRGAGLVFVVVLAVAALGVAVAAHHPEDTASPAQDSRVWIDPPSVGVDSGETFTVTVRVDNAQDMIGYEFEMSWKSSVVNVIEVTDAGSLLEEPQTVPDISDGILSFVALVLPPPYEDGADGDFPLAVITLQAVGWGTSELNLDSRKVKWTDIDLIEHEPSEEGGVDDGVVSVAGAEFAVYMPVMLRNYGP